MATILHADLDAFYASVEQLLDPSLRGKPVAVGGGVVLAASYEAKAFGVRGGMPGRRARELCPELIFVGGHFSEYQRLGDAAMGVLGDFTPLVERISIDEAFADVCRHRTSVRIAGRDRATIRRRVRSELGLPISVGVARTKHLAKIASQVAKPDGLVVVDPATELEFLHALPVELMWGSGRPRPRASPRSACAPSARSPRSAGRARTAARPRASEKFSALAWNRDPRAIRTHRRARSAGAQSALGRKPAAERIVRPALRHLADRIGSRLRAKSRHGRTVTVRVRFADLRSVTRSLTLPRRSPQPRSCGDRRGAGARRARRSPAGEVHLAARDRGVEPGRAHLSAARASARPARRGAPARRRKGAARWLADRALDKVRDRFGWEAAGYASVVLGSSRSVPDAFRELAEKEL
jgi:DNA polymerase-4